MAQEAGPTDCLECDLENITESRTVKRTTDEESLRFLPLAPIQRVTWPHSRLSEGGSSPPKCRFTRWSMDDARRDEYWKGYWDREKVERKRDRYSEYRGLPRRRDLDIRTRLPLGEITHGDFRREPPVLRAVDGHEPMKSLHGDGQLPPKRPIETNDEGYEEEVHFEGGRSVRRRHTDRPTPPRPRGGSPDLESPGTSRRLPSPGWMSSSTKNHLVASIGEFVGTTMFLFFAFAGTQVAKVSGQNKESSTTGDETVLSIDVLLYIALVFGFSLMVNVWVFFRVSGGLFNPAVTLAMALTKSISKLRAVLLAISQIGGSIFASFLVKILFPKHVNVRTSLSANTSLAQGVFIEMILTFELVFTILMLAKEKHKATFLAPIGIGLSLFIAALVGLSYTGASLNPARSFGPCVVSGVFEKEHWIYWIGPCAGALIAVLFYNLLKVLEFEFVNPGQDAESYEDALVARHQVGLGIRSTS